MSDTNPQQTNTDSNDWLVKALTDLYAKAYAEGQVSGGGSHPRDIETAKQQIQTLIEETVPTFKLQAIEELEPINDLGRVNFENGYNNAIADFKSNLIKAGLIATKYQLSTNNGKQGKK